MLKSEAGRFFLGAIYSVGGRFFSRIVGLASTVVLARVLTPDDYGIVAIGMIVLNFCQSLIDTGKGQYIIKSEVVSDGLVNTAWTLGLVLNGAVIVFIVASSASIAAFFRMPEAHAVIVVMSLTLLLDSLANPGVALLEREQKYENIFRAGLIVKSLTAIVVVITALLTRSYWALVLGSLLASLFGCIASYVIHPHRPQFSWENARDQWLFSKWLLFGSIFGFARSQFDTGLVGRVHETSEVGAYHNMKYLGTLAATQIVLPALSPLLATISKSRDTQAVFKHQIEVVFLVIASSIWPLSWYMYHFAEDIVYLVLGSQWTVYAGLFGYLALLSFPLCYARLTGIIATTHGKTDWLFIYNVVTFVLLGGALLYVMDQPVEFIALTRLAVDVVISMILFLTVAHILAGISPIRLTYLMMLPTVACFASLALTEALGVFLGQTYPFMVFVLESMLFGVFYGGIFLLIARLFYQRDPVTQHIVFLIRSAIQQVLSAMPKIQRR